jgi:estrogen-related receptor beta like 1
MPLPAGNQGEQFFYFTNLCSWLLGLAGIEVPAPKEFDDPNQSCNSIIGACKKLGFSAPSYNPMKLTAGYGKEVCGVLEGIAEYVLEKKNFTFKAPVYLPENYAAAEGDAAEEEELEMAEQEEFLLPEYAEDQNEEEAYMASQVIP